MAANPALVQTADGQLAPAPFTGEVIALRRDAIDCSLDNVRTRSGRWSARGVLYLTNMRLVFVALKPDAESGLAAFELPLAYLRNDKFNQPIFGCNNLAGECWPAVAGGGPAGRLPPHKWAMYFKEGGVGTFLPLYFRFLEYIRALQARTGGTGGSNGPTSSVSQPQQQASAPAASEALLRTAFVDPSDPTKLYLSQPVDDSQRLPTAPKYAATYGANETYEDTGIRP
ncbi:hypothetical protein WJX72_002644 [[Myrmecia] bisecta]|uniref:Uncharacterized protein n=1 Tax=[Myrmecia] bisecta TaxID=41462 RepID=A0AAW1R5M7_9CHLO